MLHKEPQDTQTQEALSLLAEDRFAFVEIGEEKLTPTMIEAKELFGADRAGIALRTEFVNKRWIADATLTRIDGFPALQRQGTKFRVLETSNSDPESLQKAINLLGLPSEVHQASSSVLIINELVEDAERPQSITQKELDDWVDRIKSAGFELSMDIDEKAGLDNFVRFQGRLCWCDGDIADAKALPEAEVDNSIDNWQQKLERFVNLPFLRTPRL